MHLEVGYVTRLVISVFVCCVVIDPAVLHMMYCCDADTLDKKQLLYLGKISNIAKE